MIAIDILLIIEKVNASRIGYDGFVCVFRGNL